MDREGLNAKEINSQSWGHPAEKRGSVTRKPTAAKVEISLRSHMAIINSLAPWFAEVQVRVLHLPLPERLFLSNVVHWPRFRARLHDIMWHQH